MSKSKKRCLIVERHIWETGGAQQQLQFVLKKAEEFFGAGKSSRKIRVRVFVNPRSSSPSFEKEIVISKEYANGTRRTNGFPEMGNVPASFVFFEETDTANMYDVWWLSDMVPIAARYCNWVRGKDTQYGRGRYSLVIDAPAPRSA
jgi:hypothetical protein